MKERKIDAADNGIDDLKKDLTTAEEETYVDSLAKDSASKSEKKNTASPDPVDEIVKEESDRLLKSDDEALERQFDPPQGKKSLKEKLKSAAVFWWEHKKLRYGTFVGLFLLIVIAIFAPPSRYFMLNTAGVRVSSSLSIVDSETGLPLKNIPVRLQGQEKRSDDDGFVQFSDLKLGNTQLNVQRLGYATYEKTITLGWGSNPLGNQSLVATGTRFSFVLSDWLSGQAVTNAEATSGEDFALSDDQGVIVLTVSELNDETVATISAEGYRAETLKLSEAAETHEIAMVPARKHVFVSNRSGQYDLYKIDIDGQNEEILVPATGSEREIPHVVPHQTQNATAYISSREGEVNENGFVLDGLYIVNITSGDLRRVTRSEQLQIVGWHDTKLIYTAVSEGVSASNPERSKVFSYDINTGERLQLATSNYFNDVDLVQGTVYYSVSSFAVPQSSAKLFSISPDGTNHRTVIDQQVWSIIRSSFDTLHFQAVNSSFQTQWYTQQVQGEPQLIDAPPVTQNSRYYTASPNGEQALWVDVRDGKGVLLSYQTDVGGEEVLRTVPGLTDPVYWLNDETVVYRIATSQETADYVLSLRGGESQKIADVVGNRSRYFY